MPDSLVDSKDFDWLCQMLREETAILVDARKAYLVEARLSALARAEGRSVADVFKEARASACGAPIRQRIIEAMTTNETSFFRDPRIFRSIEQDVLAALFRARPTGPIHIWCAASSTGQEPYSLAMAILTRYPNDAPRVSIVATDIDTQALARAEQGVYSQLEVNRGLPPDMRARFFEKQGQRWQIKAEVRSRVAFSQLNLVKPWPQRRNVDLVLIRNVLIYFDQDTKADIMTRAASTLGTGGMLILGGTESALGCQVPLEAEKLGHCTVYRRRAA